MQNGLYPKLGDNPCKKNSHLMSYIWGFSFSTLDSSLFKADR